MNKLKMSKPARYFVIPMIFFIAGFVSSGLIRSHLPESRQVETAVDKNYSYYSSEDLPYLDLSPLLFPESSYGFEDLSTDGKTLDSAIIIGEVDTVSPPSVAITLNQKEYSNEIKDLPQISKDEDIFTYYYSKEEGKSIPGPFHDLKREQINKYGNLARRFLVPEKNIEEITAGEEFIDEIKEADVDNDGKKEQIIELYTCGANCWETRSLVVKNNKIVFTAQGNFPEIVPSGSHNGFTLIWGDNFKKNLGYMKTRFIWKDNQFVPIFEQQVRYLEVGNK